MHAIADDSYIFTSESVSEGHPDKICDQISDAVLDAYLRSDPNARAAIETMVTTNRVIIAGETRGGDNVDVEKIARDTIRRIGYEQEGFHWKTARIEILLHEQSPDIARGVDAQGNKDEGAGDQGIMFGYACNETPNFMPAPIGYANAILKGLSDARHSGTLPMLGPDAKSQVSLVYEHGLPARASSIVLSTQHKEGLSQEDVREIVRPYVIEAMPEGWMPPEEAFYVNPTGQFIVGGPDGDAGGF